MASRALRPEKFAMRVLIAMTARAIQGTLLGLSKRNSQEVGHVCKHLSRHPGMTSRPNGDMRPYSLERSVIHPGGPLATLVLAMAAAAVLNGGVEGGRLLCKVCRRTGVAFDACRCFDPASRRVAAFAFAVQKGVSGRKSAGLESCAPTGDCGRSGPIKAGQRDDGGDCAADDQDEIEAVDVLHVSHRSP